MRSTPVSDAHLEVHSGQKLYVINHIPVILLIIALDWK